jgi:hypothetical protein
MTWRRMKPGERWRPGKVYRWGGKPDSTLWITYEMDGKYHIRSLYNDGFGWHEAPLNRSNPSGPFEERDWTEEERLIVIKKLISMRNDA